MKSCSIPISGVKVYEAYRSRVISKDTHTWMIAEVDFSNPGRTVKEEREPAWPSSAKFIKHPRVAVIYLSKPKIEPSR